MVLGFSYWIDFDENLEFEQTVNHWIQNFNSDSIVNNLAWLFLFKFNKTFVKFDETFIKLFEAFLKLDESFINFVDTLIKYDVFFWTWQNFVKFSRAW